MTTRAPDGAPEAAVLAPEAFRYRRPVEVRFRDLDPMGHVHHSLPLIYFEEARAAYWRDVAGQSGLHGIGYVLAHFDLDFHGRIMWPQQVEVLARVPAVGRKSWVMQYQLRSAQGQLLASGESVQAMFDYAAERTMEVPPEIRERIERFEGRAGASSAEG